MSKTKDLELEVLKKMSSLGHHSDQIKILKKHYGVENGKRKGSQRSK